MNKNLHLRVPDHRIKFKQAKKDICQNSLYTTQLYVEKRKKEKVSKNASSPQMLSGISL